MARRIDTCHLLRLPPELREQIYYLLFEREDDHCDMLHISLYQQITLTTSTREPREQHGDDAAILRTCRLIYNEALPVLYDCNKFIVTVTGADRSIDPTRLRHLEWFPSLWQSIRHVKLVVQLEEQFEHVLSNVRAWVDACHGNRLLHVSQVMIWTHSRKTVPAEPVLQLLSQLVYRQSLKLWLKTIAEGSMSCSNASLTVFLNITGGRDCSDDFEGEEERKRFKSDTAKRLHDNWQPHSSQLKPRTYPAWELIWRTRSIPQNRLRYRASPSNPIIHRNLRDRLYSYWIQMQQAERAGQGIPDQLRLEALTGDLLDHVLEGLHET